VRKYYSHKSKILLEQFEAASMYKHPGVVGTNREEAIRQILSEVLHNHFGIATGEIHSELGCSNQIDIIIYDATTTNGFSINGVSKIIPGESVRAIVEVKSRLSKSKLLEGIDNIKSALKVVPRPIDIMRSHIKPFNAIFAYQLNGNSLNSLAANLNDIVDKNPGTPVNLVAVLSSGLIHFDHDYSPYNYFPFYNSTEYGAFPLEDNTLEEFCETIKSQIITI